MATYIIYSRGPKATTYRIKYTYGCIFGLKGSRGNLFPNCLVKNKQTEDSNRNLSK